MREADEAVSDDSSDENEVIRFFQILIKFLLAYIHFSVSVITSVNPCTLYFSDMENVRL